MHGVCGAWGVLALGLFADGTYGDKWNSVEGTVKGLFYGDGGQFLAQIISVCTNIILVFCASWVVFKLIDLVIGMRVSRRDGNGRPGCRRNGRQWLIPTLPWPRRCGKETANGELG